MMSEQVILRRISMTDEFVDETLGEELCVYALENICPVPDRAPDGHKGQFGRMLLIGGAEGMAGAMILAARAGEKMGVGYTMVRTVESSMPLLATAIPSALLSTVPEGEGTKKDLPQPTAIAIGFRRHIGNYTELFRTSRTSSPGPPVCQMVHRTEPSATCDALFPPGFLRLSRLPLATLTHWRNVLN
jgi:hypothetical protein